MQPDGNDGGSTTRSLYSRDIRETKISSHGGAALFRLVSGSSWPVESLACLRMHARHASATSLRVEKWRLGYSHREFEMTGPPGTVSFAVSCSSLFSRDITNELDGLRSATHFYLNGNPSSCYVCTAFPFSIFHDISRRYKLCMDEMQFSFFRETTL